MKKHNVAETHREAVKNYVRQIHFATTIADAEEHLMSCTRYVAYHLSPEVSSYLDNEWMSCVKTWSLAYADRVHDITMSSTNNYIESYHRKLKDIVLLGMLPLPFDEFSCAF
jgi:hypothetical protein